MTETTCGQKCCHRSKCQRMAEATMTDIGGIGDAESKSENIQVRQYRYGDTDHEQARRYDLAAKTKADGYGNSRVRENGWHLEGLSIVDLTSSCFLVRDVSVTEQEGRKPRGLFSIGNHEYRTGGIINNIFGYRAGDKVL